MEADRDRRVSELSSQIMKDQKYVFSNPGDRYYKELAMKNVWELRCSHFLAVQSASPVLVMFAVRRGLQGAGGSASQPGAVVADDSDPRYCSDITNVLPQPINQRLWVPRAGE